MEMPVWLLLTFLVVLAVASPRYGVDSRLPPAGERPAPRHRATVRIRSRGTITVRTRPIFDGWSAVVHGTYLPSLLDRDNIVEFYRMAGLYGLGDYTPEFGRFQVEEISLE